MFSDYLLNMNIINPEMIIDYLEHNLGCETDNDRERLQTIRAGLHYQARNLTESRLRNHEANSEAIGLLVTLPGNVESALNGMYDYVWNGYDTNIRHLRTYYMKTHPCPTGLAVQEAWKHATELR